MSLRINTNVPSLTAQNRLTGNKEALDHVQNKLSSGSRIIRSMDDAAGLAISENLRATLRSTEQNIKEANNGVYLLQTADSALNFITNMVIRMKELATSAASDTNGDRERGYLDNEVQSLKEELNRTAKATVFNGRSLLTGEGGDVAVQVGPRNNPEVDRISIAANFDINADTLGIASLEVASVEGARESLDTLMSALDVIAKSRGTIGAGEAALDNTIKNLMQYQETLSGAFSQIRDADIAAETAEQAKYNILTQAGVAILSQANQTPAMALKLLQG